MTNQDLVRAILSGKVPEFSVSDVDLLRCAGHALASVHSIRRMGDIAWMEVILAVAQVISESRKPCSSRDDILRQSIFH